MTTSLLSASSINGTTVKNGDNEDLGDIKDLMVDPETGSIEYAVLSFGGFLGVGDKLFAVPMKTFGVDRADEKFVLNVTKENLDDAPGFDKDNWPNFADGSFRQQIDDFYAPYQRAA